MESSCQLARLICVKRHKYQIYQLDSLSKSKSLPPSDRFITYTMTGPLTELKGKAVNGVEIFYREANHSSSKTVLLLHGYPTVSMAISHPKALS